PAATARLRPRADRGGRAGLVGRGAGHRRHADRDRGLAPDLPDQTPVRAPRIFLRNMPFGILGIILAWRWWPETWALSSVGKEVDVRGMLLLGGAVLFLTMALIEANPFGGDLPLWLSLMQGAILLGVLFFWWERRAPDPIVTPGLLANTQVRNANNALLL